MGTGQSAGAPAGVIKGKRRTSLMTASQWGIKFPFCVECKSTLRKHQARSLCTKCYPQKILKKLCSKCNKINVLSRRINEENICGVCNKKLFCPPKK